MPPSPPVHVEVLTSPADLPAAFEVNCAAFGTQTNDGIWAAIFPRWNTPVGKAQAISRLANRLQTTGTNHTGQPNTVFLKATVPAPAPAVAPKAAAPPDARNAPSTGERVIAGFAIWEQASAIEGYGAVPLEDEISDRELALLYPADEPEQRYLRQLLRSLHKRRAEVIRQKAATYLSSASAPPTSPPAAASAQPLAADPPAVFVLDSCAVDPALQRMGIATALVRWGLEEARRRGGLECVTEGSRMGRHVYLREGFRAEGDGLDMGFEVDPEFAGRDRPPNVFLRTGGG